MEPLKLIAEVRVSVFPSNKTLGRGLGATFCVSFPIVAGTVEMVEKTKEVEFVAKQEILLVEDNKSTALVMERFLKKMGHGVKTAYCIKEGKKNFSHNLKFDFACMKKNFLFYSTNSRYLTP